jgi:hypothetical protein
MLFYVSMFYPRERTQLPMTAIIFGILTSQSVGAALAVGFLRMDGLGGLAGWQWLFIIGEGRAARGCRWLLQGRSCCQLRQPNILVQHPGAPGSGRHGSQLCLGRPPQSMQPSACVHSLFDMLLPCRLTCCCRGPADRASGGLLAVCDARRHPEYDVRQPGGPQRVAGEPLLVRPLLRGCVLLEPLVGVAGVSLAANFLNICVHATQTILAIFSGLHGQAEGSRVGPPQLLGTDQGRLEEPHLPDGRPLEL